MTIDNYLIANPHLAKLVLIGVNLGNEELRHISGTLSSSVTLKSLDLSCNCLKDSGARQLAEVLLSN
jgi:hypothetical protein